MPEPAALTGPTWELPRSGPRAVPTLIVHGGRDRIVPPSHANWLASRIPAATLRLRPDDGHISVLRSAPAALEWLAARVR